MPRSSRVRPAPALACARAWPVLAGALAAGVAGAQSSEGTGSDGGADDRVAGGRDGLTTGNDRLRLTISGQVDRGMLFYDDGEDSGAIHVDNDNSSTRIRFVTESVDDSALTLGALIEIEFQSNPSNLVDQQDQRGVGDGSFDERKFEVYAKSERYGQLLVGQGETATDGTAEVDLSGTGLAGFSSVDSTAGGMRFRAASGALSEVDAAAVFGNLDGLGRDDRLRYDTPTVAGLTGSVSFASRDARDAALRWSRNRDDESWQGAAAIGYSDIGTGSGDRDGDSGDGDADSVESRVSASASVLLDAGWNLTLAAGRGDADDRVPAFGYVKLGRRLSPFGFGQTRVSIDLQVSSEIARPDERATSAGLELVQRIDRYNASVFAGLRRYELEPGERSGSADGSSSSLADTGDASVDVAVVGLRVPF